MWGYPNQWNGQGGGGEAFGIFTALSCVAFFTLILMLLYLWLFYRIFKRAGYSGWYTLINLVPYVGSIVVLFILAFGDWPMLRRREGQPYGYDRYNQPPYPPSTPSGYTTGQAPPWGQSSSPPPPPVYPPEPVEQPPTGPEPPVSP